MDAEFAECLRLYQAGETTGCIKRLLNFLADYPGDPDAQFWLALIGSSPDLQETPESRDAVFDQFLAKERRTADDYEKLGKGLRDAGFQKLAEIAFRTAAAKDREDPQRERPWGDEPFNGQKKRVDLFREILKLVAVEAIVETGTFRGATTLFFHQAAGVDVYSCELSDRYFHYASEALGPYPGIHLARADSRAFIAQLACDAEFKAKRIFFYLDAHWNADLPLLEELKLVFGNFKSPVVMIDDFELPHRCDFGFDDYGEDAVLSIDILEPILTPNMRLFFPNWVPSPEETFESARGFVILAKGAAARSIGALTEYLSEFDGLNAALRQIKRYRRTSRACLRHFEEKSAALQGATAELEDKSRALEQARAELIKNAAVMQNAGAELQKKSIALDQAKAGLVDKDAALRGTAAELQERSAAVQQAKAELLEKEAALQRAGAELQERSAALQQTNAALQEKDACLQEATLELRERSAAFEQAKALLEKAKYDQRIAAEKIEELESAIKRMEETFLWRATHFLSVGGRREPVR